MSREFLIDAVERVAATFLVAFLGVLTVALQTQGFGLEWKSVLASAALAGLIAAYDVVKVVAARFVGSKDSASLVD
jgi:hypothetical protein